MKELINEFMRIAVRSILKKGWIHDRSGTAHERSTAALKRSTSTHERSGTAIERSTATPKRSGTAIERSSVALKRSGMAYDRSALAPKRSGTAIERSGIVLARLTLNKANDQDPNTSVLNQHMNDLK